MSPSYTLDQEFPHPLYYNIPSPFYHCETDDVFIQHMYDLYLQQQSQITEENAPNTVGSEMGEHSEYVVEILGESGSIQNESMLMKDIPKTRILKKNRHSKIETAQGPRDRRMRLSLQVARDFFDLQDKLGFNKASKTLEWLLSQSKSAIKDLTNSSANNTSFTSKCEVASQEKGKHLVSPTKEVKNPRGSTRKSAFNPLAKESREKARERARERTREKRKGNDSNFGSETTITYQMDFLTSLDS